MSSRPRSVVIWRGASRIDGAPVVVIATGLRGDSQNRKTGRMIQTWIIRADVEPHTAARNGQDESICGDCPHRADENGDRSCYVRVQDAPLTIFRAFRRGRYPQWTPRQLGEYAAAHDLPVRIGAYGDPGAVPVTVWKPIVARAPRITAYTHRWQHLSPAWSRFAMASTDSAVERFEAHRRGWRSFRVSDEPGPGEILCPSERGVSCADCALCGGQLKPGAKSITIPAHGSGARFVRAREEAQK